MHWTSRNQEFASSEEEKIPIHPILDFFETGGLRALSSLPSRECKFYSIEQIFTGGRDASPNGAHLALSVADNMSFNRQV